MAFKEPSWRLWPILAVAIAVLFIIWDLSLVSRAHSTQKRIGEQVDRLEHLAQLKEQVHHLTLVHRADVNIGLDDWHQEYPATLGRIRSTDAPVDTISAAIRQKLLRDLHACDSIRTALDRSTDHQEEHRHVAVLNLLLTRSASELDAAAHAIHEHGLGRDISRLGANWQEVQALLFLACLLAVGLAWLVGSNRRLLQVAVSNAGALEAAKNDLEHTNIELRETMLSKEEKEVMIKEIHHRVKNNLQIVRSLIRFQTDKVTDPATMELFNECINRVGAMALVHEQTYLSKDLANIEVGGYLDSLVRDLISAYNIRLQLHMDIDIQVKTLGVDTLVPLGLLINEVISNSFKHAFKGREQGAIIVHLKGSEGALDLVIGDDGIGLPDPKGWERPQSLGMDLIQTLAGQLDSSVELRPGPGTVYQLRSIPKVVRKRA